MITKCVICGKDTSMYFDAGDNVKAFCLDCNYKALQVYQELSRMFQFHVPTMDYRTERSVLNLGTVSEASELLATLIPALETTTSFLQTLLLACKAVESSGFQADVWKKELVLNLNLPNEKTIKECYDSIYYPIKLAQFLGCDIFTLLKYGNDVNEAKYKAKGGYYAKNVDKELTS